MKWCCFTAEAERKPATTVVDDSNFQQAATLESSMKLLPACWVPRSSTSVALSALYLPITHIYQCCVVT